MKNAFLLGMVALLVAGYLYSQQIKNTQLTKGTTETNSQSDNTSEETKINFPLDVSSPKDKITVSSSIIQVEGKTGPGAEVFINEKETKADLMGNFSVNYELFEGENNIFVTANDTLGNYAEKSLTVFLESTQ